MFKRDLSGYTEKNRSIYDILLTEGLSLFKRKAGKAPTIFHEILVDRVADAYLTSLKINGTDAVGEKKLKIAQEQLQSWLRMVFLEAHSAERRLEAKKDFYQEVVKVLNDLVLDDSLRREVFIKLKAIVEEER